MSRQDTDVFIAGAGLAGLTAALAFGHAGFRVILVAPQPPVLDAGRAGRDLRSTAFLQPAVALLDQIGLWHELAPTAMPLNRLTLVDSVGRPAQIRDSRSFEAGDLGQEAFGWNLMNWAVSAALMQRLAQCETVELRFGASAARMTTRETGAIVRLSDGQSIGARLVIAADGRKSTLREAAGLRVETKRTGQRALAFTVTHANPHERSSTEIYHEGGPFTLVPLPDVAGRPASAVVWMSPAAEAQRLTELPEAAFNQKITERSLGWLGPLERCSPIGSWPIIVQHAPQLTAQRTALIAEAAHVVPPIGAQGLNTSLNDVIALRDLAIAAPDRLGDQAMLDAYGAERARDIALRVSAIDLFNRVTRSGLPAIQAIRLAGLRGIHGIAPLRQAVMQAGMGALPPSPFHKRAM